MVQENLKNLNSGINLKLMGLERYRQLTPTATNIPINGTRLRIKNTRIRFQIGRMHTLVTQLQLLERGYVKYQMQR